MEESCIFDGWRGVLEAPRTVQERSGDNFWRLRSALDAILGVLGAPRDFLGVFLALPEGSCGLLERSWELLKASW